jgi:hypothetical protein
MLYVIATVEHAMAESMYEHQADWAHVAQGRILDGAEVAVHDLAGVYLIAIHEVQSHTRRDMDQLWL